MKWVGLPVSVMNGLQDSLPLASRQDLMAILILITTPAMNITILIIIYDFVEVYIIGDGVALQEEDGDVLMGDDF
jgi:hypothetical protein